MSLNEYHVAQETMEMGDPIVKRVLGVMTSRVRNPVRFAPYYAVAIEEGFDDLVVFTPNDVNLREQFITGYVHRNGQWIRQNMKYPTISFDIGYYHPPQLIRKVAAIKEEKSFPFIGYGLGNKWTIHQQLVEFPVALQHLIPTKVMEDESSLLWMLHSYDAIILKPINGKEGIGIIRVSKMGDGYCLEENLTEPRIYKRDQFQQMYRYLQSKGKLLIQQWIDIRNGDDLVFDIRSLLQKDKQGQWQIAGMAVREGRRGSIISNLMGGGKPHEAFPYLQKKYGKREAQRIDHHLRRLSVYIPECLEIAYGKRQAELGLDFAVDQNGQIWLIEVNIKPGKIPFQSVFQLKTREQQIRAPIQYASYVAETTKSSIP